MRNEVKPNLIIIGAMRSSTTLLWCLLRQHPEVWFPSIKEPAYFSREDFNDRRQRKTYLALFKPCPNDKKIIGEASVDYTKLPHFGPVPRRIKQLLDKPKLIYIIRDPVERVISQYKFSYLRGYLPLNMTLEEAINKHPHIIYASRYAYQLNEYYKVFGPDSVFIVIAERMHAQLNTVMAEVEKYLDIAPLGGRGEYKMEEVNSLSKIKETAGWYRLFGQSKWIKRAVMSSPHFIIDFLKQHIPPSPEAPETTHADRDMIFDIIASDLRELIILLDDKIDLWPSVMKLKNSSNACRTFIEHKER